jgi:hypothetical protein
LTLCWRDLERLAVVTPVGQIQMPSETFHRGHVDRERQALKLVGVPDEVAEHVASLGRHQLLERKGGKGRKAGPSARLSPVIDLLLGLAGTTLRARRGSSCRAVRQPNPGRGCRPRAAGGRPLAGLEVVEKLLTSKPSKDTSMRDGSIVSRSRSSRVGIPSGLPEVLHVTWAAKGTVWCGLPRSRGRRSGAFCGT